MNIVYTTHLIYLLLSECIYSQVIVCTTPPSDCMSYYHVNPSDGIYYGVISVLPMDWSYLTINAWSTIPQKSSISFNISRIIEERPLLAGGFKYFFLFTPKIGEMIQFDLRIFFRWLGEKPPSRLYLHRHFPSFLLPNHLPLRFWPKRCQQRLWKLPLSKPSPRHRGSWWKLEHFKKGYNSTYVWASISYTCGYKLQL